MPKFDRRLVVDSTLLGVLITVLVAAADRAGLLAPLERWLYDVRAATCQHWTPPPTDKLVHLDIDGPSLDAIGHWPWDRADLAAILDELRLAHPAAVALDVQFSEPQKRSGKVEPDALLAGAIRRLGNCVVAASFPFRREELGQVFEAVRAELFADPERGEADVEQALRARGWDLPDLAAQVHSRFTRARRDALRQRVDAAPPGTEEPALLRSLLPHADLLNTPAYNAFLVACTQAHAARSLRRLAVPPQAPAPRAADLALRDAPLAALANAAAAGGFVDYPQFVDGRVRSVPLLISSDGALYPQLGLALAMKALGADPGGLRATPDELIVPRGALGDLHVPVRTVPAAELLGVGRDVPLSANVSWFGTHDWETMYDWPRHRVPLQHLPMTAVWDACQVRRRIERNNENADRAMMNLLPDALFDEFSKPLPFDDVDGYRRRIDRFLDAVEPPPQDDKKRPEYEAALVKLRAIRDQNPRLREELAQHRQGLEPLLRGKAVLVGWTAAGVIADFVPTSLHPKCPGVVLHGVIFNQVLTGDVWRTLPWWATLLATLVTGGLMTLAVSFLPPSKALVTAALLLAGYLLLNGYVLFDYGNLVLGAAAPSVAVVAVFGGGTLAKLVVERRERARITRRFSSYVDPKLVDYVLRHPDQAHFEGQVREMTVVFCDVAGFTRLTETRGSDTVPMLNALWAALVPVIKRHGGLINKFLGDGIMFFYGAPEQSPRHARDAVTTVLAMQRALERFNEEVAAPKQWPAMALRWGVSTGNMVVGDAGYTAGESENRADYTVLGDNVNLAARLEAANKAVGTSVLVTGQTYEESKDAGVLFRPIGKLCVVGKQTGVMVYEPLAGLDTATEDQKRLATHTRAVVESFLEGRVRECAEAVERMEAECGRGRLMDLYRERCNWFLREPRPEPFDCQIVLTEK